MASASNANPSMSVLMPGYDSSGHQLMVAVRLVNIATDATVTPNVVYGDLGVVLTSGYPAGALPVNNSSGDSPNASAVATLAGVSSKTTYISGFEITGSGATVALNVIATVSGLLGGTCSYVVTVGASALGGNNNLIVNFSPALPATTTNTAIVVTCPALGLGNLHSVVNAHGYQL